MNGQLPSNPEKKTRLTTLDLVKGAAIIGVVIFHVALTQAHGPDPETATGIGLMTFKSIPYSLLCTFIVISGYFYVSGRSFLENVRRRVLKLAVYLIVAIVVLTSLMYLILWIQGGYDLELSQLWDVIWENVIGRGAFKTFDEISVYGGFVLAPFEVTHQMYYLQMLVVGYLIFYAIVDRVIDDPRKLFAAVFILMTMTAAYVEFVGVVLPFYAHLGPMAAGFLLIGAYLSRIQFVQWLESAAHDKRYWGLFVLATVTAFGLCFITPQDASIVLCHFGPFGGWSLYSFAVLSLAGGVMFMYIFSWLRNVKVAVKTLGTVGLLCISVYILHMFVAKCLVAPFVTFDTTTWIPIGTVAGIALALITVAVIVCAAKIYYAYSDGKFRKSSN
jgi:fucose 4-O-acetylase-like acetyltransferase